MSLDLDTVRRIAHLAHIRVPDDELALLTTDLGNILTFVEQLSQVDTTSVTPMTSAVATALPLRTDEVSDGGYASAVLANAPDRTEGFFVVPKVVE